MNINKETLDALIQLANIQQDDWDDLDIIDEKMCACSDSWDDGSLSEGAYESLLYMLADRVKNRN